MLVPFIRTLILYVAIIAAIRLMGKRQVGELQPGELVVTILVSAVASVPLQDVDIPLLHGLVPILTLMAAEVILSGFCQNHIGFRRLLTGNPVLVIRDRHAFVPASNITNPAQIYIAKETHEELHAALDAISNQEREYLLYRFGFEDDMEHPLTETAEHFFLSESRAKSTEKLALDNVWLELPWWFH